MDLMTLDEVCAMTKLSRQTIYRWRRAGRFPQPLFLGDRSMRWHRGTVERWVRERRGAKGGDET